MDNKTKKAVEMLKKLAKSVDGTSTEERINEVIAVLDPRVKELDAEERADRFGGGFEDSDY